MKTTYYRPDDALEVMSLLHMTVELLLNDARVEDVVLASAPDPVPQPPEDPEAPPHYQSSVHERIERGWRRLLPQQNHARDILEFRLTYGWNEEEIVLISDTCAAAAHDLRKRAPDSKLTGTSRSMQHHATVLEQLSRRWLAVLREEESHE